MTTQFSTPPNLYERFLESVRSHPHKLALVETSNQGDAGKFRSESITFQQFHHLVTKQRLHLEKQGFTCGSRVLVVLPPSIRMYALVSAMFADGVVPVFIDPTMARAQYLQAIRAVPLNGAIAVPQLLKHWLWIRGLRRPSKFSFEQSGWGYSKWDDFTPSSIEMPLPSLSPHMTGLITFTSGSTGIPKAADRTNEILFAQREISKALWTAGESDTELTAFPMVVLSNLVYGVTTALPPLDAQLSDATWVEQTQHLIEKFQVTRMAVSPFHLHQLSRSSTLSKKSVQRIVVGGATVPNWLIQKAMISFPSASGHIVYGSTEAEPISHASFADALQRDEDKGYFVGGAIDNIQIRLKDGEVELSGPHVIQRYLFDHKENHVLKVRDQNKRVWHKTRDFGDFDSDQTLWLKGRWSDNVSWKGQSYFPYPIEHKLENLLNSRVALIQKSSAEPHLVVEYPSSQLPPQLEYKIRDQLPDSLRMIPISGREKMPVDRRHRWRINRPAL